MQNKSILIGAFYVLAVFGLVLSSSMLVRRLPDSGQGRVEREIPVYFRNSVSQAIRPLNNGLNVIVIFMKNISLRNQKPLQFTLSDDKGKVIRTINLTGYNIGDGDNVRFQFDPVLDSAGKIYSFSIFSEDSTPNDAIGIGYASGDPYPYGNAIFSGAAGEDLAFELFYFPTSKQEILFKVTTGFLKSLFSVRFLILVVSTGIGLYYFSRFVLKNAYVQDK